MKRIYFSLIILAATSFARADFDDLGANARAVAMGGAVTALADDAQNITVNPAGLGFLRRAEIGSDYGRLWMGLEDNSNLSVGSLSMGIPLNRRKKIIKTIEISTGAAPGDILRERKTVPVLSRLGALGLIYKKFALSGVYEESAIGLSWGKSVRKKWALGVSLKSLKEEYTQDNYTRVDPVFNAGGGESVSAVSFDGGLIFNPIPRVFLGLSVLDLNRPDVGLARPQKLPQTQKFGLGYRFRTISAGVDYTRRDENFTVGSGVEKSLGDGRYLMRGGFTFGSGSLAALAAGFGVKVGQARLDYAVEYPLSGVQKVVGNHRFSVVFKFGEPLSDEAEPGSLEQAYIQTRDRLADIEAKLAEVEENRNTLEKVLVEESTQRIQERIESARALARSRTLSKQEGEKSKKDAVKPSVEIKTHRVEKGDSLQSLAEKYYGNRSLWRVIYEENKDLVGRGGALKQGLLLVVPPLEGSALEAFKNAGDGAPAEKRSKFSRPDNSAPAPQAVRHVVKEGETLQSIAQKYYGVGGEWQKIYSANKDKIIRGKPAVGAELVIPPQ